MGRLYYFYGTMSSAKSLNLLAKAHQFKNTGMNVELLKPALDTRTEDYISSRAGLKEKCKLVGPNEIIQVSEGTDILMVDEVQFLTSEQIIQLWNISREMDIRVFCYGLKTTYYNELFKCISTLFIYADKIEEIKSQCSRCENKATTHILFKNDIPMEKSSETNIGDIVGEERFESLCQDCRNRIMNLKEI